MEKTHRSSETQKFKVILESDFLLFCNWLITKFVCFLQVYSVHLFKSSDTDIGTGGLGNNETLDLKLLRVYGKRITYQPMTVKDLDKSHNRTRAGSSYALCSQRWPPGLSPFPALSTCSPPCPVYPTRHISLNLALCSPNQNKASNSIKL